MKKIFTIRNLSEQQAFMWDQRAVEDEVAACSLRNIADCFRQHLPRDEKILEAGCGLGAWVIYLHDLGFNIAGVDHDARVLVRLRQWKPDLDVFEGDIRNLPYPDNGLGAYISLGVMEHFEDGCNDAMREAWRVLKPGGLLFFTVPMENLFRKIIAHPLRQLYLARHRRRGGETYFAEYRYTPDEVRKLLESFGFKIIHSTWDDFLPRHMSLGIWTDFPPLHAQEIYTMTLPGRFAAWILNSLNRWWISGGVFFLAQKPGSAP